MVFAGPCYNIDEDDVKCKIDRLIVPGYVVDANQAVCVIPLTLTRGRREISLSVDGGATYSHTGFYFFGKLNIHNLFENLLNSWCTTSDQ